MECYEGATMIKTYRGQLADGGQDQIRLKTNKGEIGYRIVKFEVMAYQLGVAVQESILKIYKDQQTSATATVDFSDSTLVAAAFMQMGDSSQYQWTEQVIFDQEVFNQDIYITHNDRGGSAPCNYYLELEQVKLNDNESTMATLQSLRTVASK